MKKKKKERKLLFAVSHKRVDPPPTAAGSAWRVARCSLAVFVYNTWPPPTPGWQALTGGVFSDRKVIFGPRRVGSDVTSASSSSGLGSSLDPEILPSFSCCSGRGGRGAEPTDVARGWRRRRRQLSVASLPFNTMVFLQMTDAA